MKRAACLLVLTLMVSGCSTTRNVSTAGLTPAGPDTCGAERLLSLRGEPASRIPTDLPQPIRVVDVTKPMPDTAPGRVTFINDIQESTILQIRCG